MMMTPLAPLPAEDGSQVLRLSRQLGIRFFSLHMKSGDVLYLVYLQI
jgi:hypothetical protein